VDSVLVTVVTARRCHQPGIEKVASVATFVKRLLAFEDLGDSRPVKADYGRNPPETETVSAQFGDSIAERLPVRPEFASGS
jgi:hypothetical protein